MASGVTLAFTQSVASFASLLSIIYNLFAVIVPVIDNPSLKLYFKAVSYDPLVASFFNSKILLSDVAPELTTKLFVLTYNSPPEPISIPLPEIRTYDAPVTVLLLLRRV